MNSDLQFILDNKKYVMYILIKRLKNKEIAEEIYQNLCLKAFRGVASFKNNKGFLAADARRLASTHCRRIVNTRTNYLEDMPDFDTIAPSTFDKEREFNYKVNLVKQAITKMRGAGVKLVTYRLKGYTPEQAYKAWGVDSKTGHALMVNSVRKIREILGISKDYKTRNSTNVYDYTLED